MSLIRTLRISIALGTVAAATMLAPTAQANSVCNQAGVAHTGGSYVVLGTPDDGPAARHKSGLKGLGNGKAQGLANAAERSSALTECGLPYSGGDGPF